MASPGFAALEVSARGSPASDCAVALPGLPVGVAVAPGVAPDAVAPDPCGAAVEAGCCATAVADMAQYRVIKLKVLAFNPPNKLLRTERAPKAAPAPRKDFFVEVLVTWPPGAPTEAVSPASVPFPVQAPVPAAAALLPVPARGPMSMQAPVPLLRCACAIPPANR